MSSPITTFNDRLEANDFVFLVYYRGSFCPFCMAYLRQLQQLTPSIKEAHGGVLVVTADQEAHLAATRKSSSYEGEVIVDTKNELAKDLKQRGLVDVAITPKAGYEHGMAQPAILIVKKNGEAIYSWAIQPSMMNLGGAKDRPDLGQVWDNANAKLHDKPMVHSTYKKTSFFGMVKGKMFG